MQNCKSLRRLKCNVSNNFKAGTILQVEITVVIYEITGCPKILIFDPAHYNAKFQSCSTIGLWGVYPEVLRAHAQKLL